MIKSLISSHQFSALEKQKVWVQMLKYATTISKWLMETSMKKIQAVHLDKKWNEIWNNQYDFRFFCNLGQSSFQCKNQFKKSFCTNLLQLQTDQRKPWRETYTLEVWSKSVLINKTKQSSMQFFDVFGTSLQETDCNEYYSNNCLRSRSKTFMGQNQRVVLTKGRFDYWYRVTHNA